VQPVVSPNALDIELIIERDGLPHAALWARLDASGSFEVRSPAEAPSSPAAKISLPEAVVRRWVGLSGRQLVRTGSLFAHVRVLAGQSQLEEFLYNHPTALARADWRVLADWLALITE
jgi:hypothetical protein